VRFIRTLLSTWLAVNNHVVITSIRIHWHGNDDATPAHSLVRSGGNLWVHSVDSSDRLMTRWQHLAARGWVPDLGSVSKQHCSSTPLYGAPEHTQSSRLQRPLRRFVWLTLSTGGASFVRQCTWSITLHAARRRLYPQVPIKLMLP